MYMLKNKRFIKIFGKNKLEIHISYTCDNIEGTNFICNLIKRSEQYLV